MGIPNFFYEIHFTFSISNKLLHFIRKISFENTKIMLNSTASANQIMGFYSKVFNDVTLRKISVNSISKNFKENWPQAFKTPNYIPSPPEKIRPHINQINSFTLIFHLSGYFYCLNYLSFFEETQVLKFGSEKNLQNHCHRIRPSKRHCDFAKKGQHNLYLLISSIFCTFSKLLFFFLQIYLAIREKPIKCSSFLFSITFFCKFSFLLLCRRY